MCNMGFQLTHASRELSRLDVTRTLKRIVMSSSSIESRESSVYDLIRFPVTDPLPFTIHRTTGLMTVDPELANVLELPESEMADAGASLVDRILDPTDRQLCRQSFYDMIDGKRAECVHYGRMMIAGSPFWICISAKANSAHASSRLIKGTVVVFNFHRVLHELFGQCDCEQQDRDTLSAFARVPIDSEAVLLSFKELCCEPHDFCEHLTHELHDCDVIFAEPLYDGTIIVAFRSEAKAFAVNFHKLDAFCKVDKEASFSSGRSPFLREAVFLRIEFMKRLASHVPVQSGLTVVEIVNLVLAFRHNFRQLQLFFQPQVGPLGFIGGEFLVRLKPDFVNVTVDPDVFIPILEKTHIIHPFGRWVVETALDQSRILKHDVKPGFRVSFNMSACQARDVGFIPFIRRCLEIFRIPVQYLMIELTETAKPVCSRRLANQIHALRELGIHTAIDDFGTGYNSIEHLFLMRYDVVKFSRKFVVSSLADPRRLRFFQNLISGCHDIGVVVCAEGVEDEAMLCRLAEMGVDLYQGYYFARPCPIAEAVAEVKHCPYLAAIESEPASAA